MTSTKPSRAEAERLIEEAKAAHAAAIAAEKAEALNRLKLLNRELKELEDSFLEARDAYLERREACLEEIRNLQSTAGLSVKTKASEEPKVESKTATKGRSFSLVPFLEDYFDSIIVVLCVFFRFLCIWYLLI
jgi:hypothetical protein